MRRRSFFFLSLAPLAVGTAVARQWLTKPEEALRSGPMLGRCEATEVAVWLQTKRSARAQLRYWKAGSPSSARLSPEVAATADRDYLARFALSALEPGSRYDYELYLDGARVERPYPLSFQTQQIWQYRADPPSARFAIGSCAYVNDAPFDRPGANYGGNPEIFGAIAAAKPDAMLWLGDNWYYREGDFYSERGMRYRASHTRALAEMQPLLGSTHNYAMWDDHDYGENDSDRGSRMRETALRVFGDYWANGAAGTPETPGCFHKFSWSDVDVFMLDDRSFRTPNVDTTDGARQMFGDAQMRWLMDGLSSSLATFKIVAGGNQMLNRATRFEAFTRFPKEQQRLLDYLAAQKVPGVVFLSGDRHHTELIRRGDAGPYPLYDFTSSALMSRGGRNADEANNPDRVDGTWVTDTRNFGLVDVSGTAKARVLTLRAVDYAGKELWKREIAAEELHAAG